MKDTDIVERLRRKSPYLKGSSNEQTMREAADEIERLRELLRSEGANRYWEGRWRDEAAESDRLRSAMRTGSERAPEKSGKSSSDGGSSH